MLALKQDWNGRMVFGGGQSLLAALAAGKQASACCDLLRHARGGRSYFENAKRRCSGNFETQDHWINSDVVKKFEENMKAAGKKLIVKAMMPIMDSPTQAIQWAHSTSNVHGANKHTIEFFRAGLK